MQCLTVGLSVLAGVGASLFHVTDRDMNYPLGELVGIAVAVGIGHAPIVAHDVLAARTGKVFGVLKLKISAKAKDDE